MRDLNEPHTVWVLIWRNEPHVVDDLVGVYTSRELAEAAREAYARFIIGADGLVEDGDIEECPLDSMPDD